MKNEIGEEESEEEEEGCELSPLPLFSPFSCSVFSVLYPCIMRVYTQFRKQFPPTRGGSSNAAFFICLKV
jgi:hypothetical protein